MELNGKVALITGVALIGTRVGTLKAVTKLLQNSLEAV